MSVQQASEGVFYRDHTRSIKIYEIPSGQTYEAPCVKVLTTDATSSCLGLSDVSRGPGRQLLQRLSRVHEPTSNFFALKEDTLSDFVFKLCWKGGESAMTRQVTGFTALSYVCHSNMWTPHTACLEGGSMDGCPLTPPLWAAFMEELGDDAPFWVDSLCIVQENGPEKQAAISAMDYVYRSAVKVVVALEDIAFTAQEAAAFASYAKSYIVPDVRSEADVSAVSSAFAKILSARWLQRAWCVHEYNLGKKYTFLVPVESSTDTSGAGQVGCAKVLRVDSSLLVRIASAFVVHDFESQRAGSYLEPDLNFGQRQSSNALRFMTRLKLIDMAEVFGTDTVSTDDSYLHMFSEIFSLGSMFVSDRLSILLNIMGCGLSYKGGLDIDEEQCYQLVALLALAAGDATMLCANGRLLGLGRDLLTESLGWLRLPGSTDNVLPPGLPAVPQMNGRVVLNGQGLEIDVVFVATPADLRVADHDLSYLAKLLIDHRYLLTDSIDEPFVNLDYEKDEEKYYKLRLCCIQALACVLELGVDWVVRYGSSSSLNLPGISEGWSENLTKAHRNGMEWALSILPEVEVGSELLEEHEEEASAIFSGKAKLEHQLFDDEDLDTSVALNSDQRHGFSKLLQFVDELVTIGVAADVSQQNVSIDDGYPTICILTLPCGDPSSALSNSSVTTPAHGIVYLPLYPNLISVLNSFELCLPVPLLDSAYRFLARSWLVTRHPQESDELLSKVHCLVAKSRVAGLTSLTQLAEGGKVDRITLS